MECFLDTNIPLAYVFSIEPNHKKANYIFNEYDKLFWSKLVLNEFNNRFNIKYQHISYFPKCG